MDLKTFLRGLRTHWKLVLVSVLVCAGAAAGLAWSLDPLYSAETQLFVSTGTGASDPSQAYQGGLFTQQRVVSYAKIVASPAIAQSVIEQLGLPDSVQHVQGEISASVPTNTVLIDVTVEDRSAATAAAIANAVGDQFPKFVDSLETARRARSPVKVSVTSQASVPSDPASPRKPLYIVLGAVFGLILGVAAAVLRERLDRRVRDDGEAAAVLGAPVLGRILRQRRAKKRPLIVVNEPTSAGAEAYRRLRTNIRAVSLEDGLRSVVVTSALPSEGKTLLVANLGLAFAQAGHRVVLVDADLRNPQLGAVLGFDSNAGLTSVLVDAVPVEHVLQRYGSLPMEVLAGGRRPSNPSELLGSERFEKLLQQLMDRADIVIVDAPALLPVTDAAILAQLASGVILVTRVSHTRTDQLRTAAESLHTVDKEVLGVVLNWYPSRNGSLAASYRAAPAET
jgi:polysaccharide biosynthesis transport protein